jgi:pimeloyl-[acyl-carrier protein] methyl ester esterase
MSSSDQPLQLIAMHGWAGDGRSWEPWRRATAGRPWSWHCGERGYGGLPPESPRWQGEGRRVLIGHSLGPHLLPPEIVAEAEAVVLLASFGRFVPPGREGRSLTVALKAMATALADGPDEATAAQRARSLLTTFLASAASPDPALLLPPGPESGPLGVAERARLRNDLALLARCQGLPPGFPIDRPVLIVAAGADAIVPASMGAELRRCLPDATLLSYPQAGHALLRAPLMPAVLAWIASMAAGVVPGWRERPR